MNSKTQKKSPFVYFMYDFKKRQEAQGRVFANGLKDVQCDPNCNDEWRNLTPDQRAQYKMRADKDRFRAEPKKLTSVGEDIRSVDRQEEMKRIFKANMESYIGDKVYFGERNNVLLDLKFIFVHVNWFFKRLPEVNKNEMEYFPAEIALGEFTLGNGIIREYHTIVSAPIPLGFNREALETSETSHRIPPEYEGGQSNFGDVLKDIVEFLEEGEPTDDGQLPKLYTTSLQTEPVMSVLKQITEGSGYEMEDFTVYSIEYLYKTLVDLNSSRKDPNSKEVPLSVAKEEFKKDLFQYVHGIECSYHLSIDGSSLHCSKAVIKQWCFTICTYCDSLIGELIRGVHMPKSKEDDPRNLTLNQSFQSKCSLNTSFRSVQSMTGVTEDYRMRVSERTPREEEERRKKPSQITVIDYSQIRENGVPVVKCADVIAMEERRKELALNRGTYRSPARERVQNAVRQEMPPRAERVEEIARRPLRRATTKSYALTSSECSVPTLSSAEFDANFPSLGSTGRRVPHSSAGRGQALKKQ